MKYLYICVIYKRTLTVGNVGPFLHDECVMWQALQESGSNAREFDFLFGDHGSYMAATDHYQQSTYFSKLLKAIINVI